VSSGEHEAVTSAKATTGRTSSASRPHLDGAGIVERPHRTADGLAVSVTLAG
jgi:hypothetical protein